MCEEEKAIKFLESKTTKYSLSGEELHYYNILYYLILNLQKENQKLKTEKEQLNSLVNSCQEEIRRLKRELQALKVSEEEWLEKSDK